MHNIKRLLCVAALAAAGSLARAQTLTLIHTFAGAEGSGPASSLVFGPGGYLYGTTTAGGASGQGTVFKISTRGAYSVVHSFAGPDGAVPYGALMFGSDGNLYGMTNTGGSANQGVIYQVTPAGSFSVAHNFTGFEGSNPYGALIEATNGNGYGFTSGGGMYGYGTAFRITPSGEYTVLYNFDLTDGAYPFDEPFDLQNGNYGGTTRRGGASGYGTGFAVNDAGVLTSLNYTSNFQQVYSGFVRGAGNTFYGTTFAGGQGYGSVYSVDGNLALSTVTYFNGGTGGFPAAGVIRATDGNLYGTATGSPITPKQAYGSIYRVTPAGVFTLLHAFSKNDGLQPFGGLLQGVNFGTSQVFYGTTYAGGANDLGVIYALTVTPAE